MLVVLVHLEAIRAPIEYEAFTAIPTVYDRLTRESSAVIVELPFYPPRRFFLNAPYMLNATRHWRPMLNGYSGIRPDGYDVTYDAILSFPDELSLSALYSRGVTHVILHERAFRELFGGDRYDAIRRFASLEVVAEDGDIRIFRLRNQ
jgi:hypothetical protein